MRADETLLKAGPLMGASLERFVGRDLFGVDGSGEPDAYVCFMASDRGHPAGMKPPPYALTWLGDRRSTICQHGFGPDIIGVDWWNQRLSESGLQPVFDPSEWGSGRLTRGHLFRLGAELGEDPTGEKHLSLLWHTLAWGTGVGQRGNLRRIRSFVDARDRSRHVALLKEAAKAAGEGDPRGAYSRLIRRGGGMIPGLGPAFFTKFLYFASECTEGVRPLILDARVAGNLSRAGWVSLPRGRGGFSYNWYTDTYVSYCELLDGWAKETPTVGLEIKPDEFERALFEGKPPEHVVVPSEPVVCE